MAKTAILKALEEGDDNLDKEVDDIFDETNERAIKVEKEDNRYIEIDDVFDESLERRMESKQFNEDVYIGKLSGEYEKCDIKFTNFYPKIKYELGDPGSYNPHLLDDIKNEYVDTYCEGSENLLEENAQFSQDIKVEPLDIKTEITRNVVLYTNVNNHDVKHKNDCLPNNTHQSNRFEIKNKKEALKTGGDYETKVCNEEDVNTSKKEPTLHKKDKVDRRKNAKLKPNEEDVEINKEKKKHESGENKKKCARYSHKDEQTKVRQITEGTASNKSIFEGTRNSLSGCGQYKNKSEVGSLQGGVIQFETPKETIDNQFKNATDIDRDRSNIQTNRPILIVDNNKFEEFFRMQKHAVRLIFDNEKETEALTPDDKSSDKSNLSEAKFKSLSDISEDRENVSTLNIATNDKVQSERKGKRIISEIEVDTSLEEEEEVKQDEPKSNNTIVNKKKRAKQIRNDNIGKGIAEKNINAEIPHPINYPTHETEKREEKHEIIFNGKNPNKNMPYEEHDTKISSYINYRYNCLKCPFKAKRRAVLKRHLLKHELDISSIKSLSDISEYDRNISRFDNDGTTEIINIDNQSKTDAKRRTTNKVSISIHDEHELCLEEEEKYTKTRLQYNECGNGGNKDNQIPTKNEGNELPKQNVEEHVEKDSSEVEAEEKFGQNHKVSSEENELQVQKVQHVSTFDKISPRPEDEEKVEQKHQKSSEENELQAQNLEQVSTSEKISSGLKDEEKVEQKHKEASEDSLWAAALKNNCFVILENIISTESIKEIKHNNGSEETIPCKEKEEAVLAEERSPASNVEGEKIAVAKKELNVMEPISELKEELKTPKKKKRESSHNSVHVKKRKSEVNKMSLYRCDECDYVSHKKKYFNNHIIIHSKEVIKCEICGFMTNLKRNLTHHMIVHLKPEEIKVAKCPHCQYQGKRNSDLTSHMLIHKNSKEIQMYQCSDCPYQSKRKANLKLHEVSHKSDDDVTVFNCALCLFKSKRKDALKSHMLVHQKAEDVRWFKCDTCTFMTKYRSGLRNHQLIHKPPEEVFMFNCTECPYQTKYKAHLKKHSLYHKPVWDVKMHHCEQCSYKSRRKQNLLTHMLQHTKYRK